MFEYKLHIDEFLNYCRYHKKLSDKTIRAYKIDLSQYGVFSNELSKQALWDYIEYLNKKYKPKTAKRKLATLKAFIHFLLLQDLIDFNPFDKLETTIKEPLLLPKTIPLGVIAKLISFSYQQIVFAKSDYQIRSAVRNTAILELLFATGARVAEICTLRSDNVDLLGNSVKFYGKGSKERIIPIENFAVLSILRKYHSLFEKEIPDSGYFFVNKLGRRMTEQSVRNMINFYCKQCGVDMHITPHMFRHSFATLLLEEDVDIRYIQRMLGHSSITTTQIYTHVTKEALQQNYQLYFPRSKAGKSEFDASTFNKNNGGKS